MRCALVLMLLASSAHAELVAPAATVSAASTTPGLRAVGDHFVALTAMTCQDDDCYVDVVDTAQLATARVHASRSKLEDKFGHASGAVRTIDATLLAYDGRRAGFLVTDQDTPGSFQWFAEIDARTGAITRSTKLAAWRDDTDVYALGADPAHDAVWLYVLAFDGPRRAQNRYARDRSAKSLVLRRIDLADLATTDVATVKLPARVQQPPLEDEVFVHAAADFSHVAVVEYYEQPRPLSPGGRAYVIDTATGESFAVPVPPVAYAVAFSPDYLYVSSSVTGELERVDLAKRAVDRTVKGPRLTHHAAITPDGKQLVLLGSSAHYVAFDLPGLAHARELVHDPIVASAFGSLDVAASSADGALFVLPFPWRHTPGDHLAPTRDYAIVRIGSPSDD